MKGIFVILDGVADEPCRVLGQITPLQAAKTPNLDFLAGKSKIDYCYTVKEGVVPESSSAVISLLGQDHRIAPRGPLEVAGMGIKLTKGDLAFRCNFASVDDAEGDVLDRRAGRTLTTKDAIILAKAINDGVNLPFKFEFYPGLQHRAVLVFRGGFSDNITNVDPDYGFGVAHASSGKIKYSEPMDDEDDSKLSAELVNNFIRQSHEILDKHPLNINRAKKGFYSANFILCRGAGNYPVSFNKLKGKWMALGYTTLEKGIAQATRMDVYNIRYPKMKGIDVYSNLYDGLNVSLKGANKMLKRNYKKYDYFYIHIKETDIPGHDNKPLDKVKMIEIIDKKLLGFLRWFVCKNNVKLVLTADHTTSCNLKSHSDKPVPVLTYPHPSGKKGDWRFTEEEGLKGKKIVSRKLLDNCLF